MRVTVQSSCRIFQCHEEAMSPVFPGLARRGVPHALALTPGVDTRERQNRCSNERGKVAGGGDASRVALAERHTGARTNASRSGEPPCNVRSVFMLGKTIKRPSPIMPAPTTRAP